MIKRSMEERFWSKVKQGPPNECWEWLGATKQGGYGVLHNPGRNSGNMLAHRYSYLLNIGDIPAAIEVCHRCDNPPCVNPNHLFLGTHNENMVDSITKGRFVYPINGVVNLSKTHCIHGHEYSPENTWRSKTGARHCLECSRDRMRVRQGYGLPHFNRSKTHCPQGHEYTLENTYRIKNGWRACRECHLARLRRKKEK